MEAENLIADHIRSYKDLETRNQTPFQTSHTGDYNDAHKHLTEQTQNTFYELIQNNAQTKKLLAWALFLPDMHNRYDNHIKQSLNSKVKHSKDNLYVIILLSMAQETSSTYLLSDSAYQQILAIKALCPKILNIKVEHKEKVIYNRNENQEVKAKGPVTTKATGYITRLRNMWANFKKIMSKLFDRIINWKIHRRAKKLNTLQAEDKTLKKFQVKAEQALAIIEAKTKADRIKAIETYAGRWSWDQISRIEKTMDRLGQIENPRP